MKKMIKIRATPTEAQVVDCLIEITAIVFCIVVGIQGVMALTAIPVPAIT